MTSEIRNVLVFLHVQVPNDIIFFGRGVHNIGLVLSEMDQVHTILFRVQGPLEGTPFAVINYNLVILGAGDQGGTIRREVHVVDGILVIPRIFKQKLRIIVK